MPRLLVLLVALLTIATIACDGSYQIQVQNGTDFPIDVLILAHDESDSEIPFKVGDYTNWISCLPCGLAPGEAGLGFTGDRPGAVVIIVARDAESKKVIYTRIESISQLRKENVAISDASSKSELAAIQIVDERQ